MAWMISSPLFHSHLSLWLIFDPTEVFLHFPHHLLSMFRMMRKSSCNHFFLVARCVVKLLLCISGHLTHVVSDLTFPVGYSLWLLILYLLFFKSENIEKIHWPFSCEISQSVVKIKHNGTKHLVMLIPPFYLSQSCWCRVLLNMTREKSEDSATAW